MKKLFLILFIFPIFTQAQYWKDFKKAAEKVNKELINQNPFSEEEAANALKETLNKGMEKGISILSAKDGYFTNLEVKIPFPNNTTKVTDKLKELGMQKQIDEVVLSINRAAEDAASSAKPIFINAIKKMKIKDAIGIVKGNKTAGTNYLNKHTNSSIRNAFRPIIKISLEKVNATKHWKSIINTYNKIPFMEKINPELEAYVTDKAMSGLFFMLAQQEIAIREDPKERTSALLKKVFGN